MKLTHSFCTRTTDRSACALLLLVMFCAVVARPQAQNNQKPPAANQQADNSDDFKISTTTNLVIETVSVKDKSGNAITDLTAKDFTLLEDNKPQEIKVFEFQKLPDTPELLPPATENVTVLKKFPHTQISPETPGTTKYRDRRLMVLYFDMAALPPADQLRAVEGARNFIRKSMTPADLVAIMAYTGSGVDVMQDFTADRDRLMTIIETIAVGESEGFDDVDTTAAAADTGAAFGQDDGEFNIFNTDRQLAALQTAVNMLGHLNEKKTLVYFSSGIRLNGTDNQAQLHATTNAAIRSRVTIWSLDSRGLVADAPMGDASKGSPGSQAMYTGQAANQFASRFQQSQDALYALAGDTGGKAFLDNNDLSAGIVQAQKSVNSYYIIGYYTSNPNLDGKFRRVKITLNNNQNASLSFEQGYYAPKTFNKFTTADKERQLEDALMMGDPITELTIAMELNYFQLNRAEYFVPVSVKIPGRELALAKKRGAEHTVIDLVGEIKDDFGTTVQNLRDKIDIKLSDEKAEELASKPALFNTGYTLLPGKYTIKVLARDAETGRIGTYLNTFTIPNLNKEEKRIPISSVVLSSQRMAISDALFNAKSKVNAESVDPLVVDGQRLLPSVTRVFSRGKDMYVYLQAYERGATTTQPLVAFVTFYRGQTKAFETSPVPVTDGLDPKSKAVPLRFNLALDKLTPGEYNCQVTVLDPGSQKAAFWQAPIMLVQ